MDSKFALESYSMLGKAAMDNSQFQVEVYLNIRLSPFKSLLTDLQGKLVSTII